MANDTPGHVALNAALHRATQSALAGPVTGGNPQVGCVILDSTGATLAVGHHRGAGTAHAEADALAKVTNRARLRGATAVVTLEPCNHTGRTGPCSQALAEAGVARVIYAAADPNPTATGGAKYLASRGIEVQTATEAGLEGDLIAAAQAVTAQWRATAARGRAWVIAKSAMSADGFVAAADGTSQWITGPASREHAHTIRASVDAIVVGTGTVRADNPSLTARTADGDLAAHQPLPVIVGTSDIPAHFTLAGREHLHLRTHDLAAVLDDLWGRGIRRVLIEGGPTLVSAALAAGLVDEWHAYRAPLLLGAGRPAIGDLGVHTLAHAHILHPVSEQRLGPDSLGIFATSKEAIDVYRTR
ncbi:MAG: bifunctional diaminohydroxyphosphoribosylaminopyrimidine deaminase/5-amino-6-(5-phosphoribosylamino)uracil reductase RibD [Actinomycetaceae bacterium]|nr:bifunctional diaminohydroxyphosphoribosylaminopyrimidine deaminase/5-amino-6-(5-phosphoribosylamino)uracil reductase RibD [Actinomycetaceae bacterium]MDU0970967.1 bifunctional diaminohydroxyphosphoribosylaminopyrimidine deaminase/5-amino-6-(5-phosphoribosylamino)uracil reductase RibD [Actinomycetaceae bacterium]